MKLVPGTAALITGAASGIGRAAALHLGAKGVDLSLVDFDEAGGLSTVNAVQALNAGGRAIFTRADVSNPAELALAFDRHMSEFGRLDICLNNAGIGEGDSFLNDVSSDGSGKWRRILAINLTSVVDGTRLAAQGMRATKRGGVIINLASAAGLYPGKDSPVYCASKGGVVLFTRSLGGLAEEGIRVNALCPEFIETGIVRDTQGRLVQGLDKILKRIGGFIPMEMLIEGMMEFIEDDSLSARCMWITKRLGRQFWPPQEEKLRYKVTSQRPGVHSSTPLAASSQMRNVEADAAAGLVVSKLNASSLKKFKKIVVQKLSTDFRDAISIRTTFLSPPVPATALWIRVYYAGVNASDVNYSAGRYFGSQSEALKKLPFDAGFEGVGVVVSRGVAVSDPLLSVGSTVAFFHYGSFAEFVQIESKTALPIQGPPTREAVALLTSGLTASIALEQAGRMGSGQTVLVTAAAGGTGQFAVQLAKLAGNTVVATCSSEEKAAVLKELGADTVINYKTTDMGKELKRQYPRGMDIVYESVGGRMFETCVNALAPQGRLIIIGMMSQYTSSKDGGWQALGHPGLCEKLLWKSQTLAGFFLLHYLKHARRHLNQLQNLLASGKLKVAVDPRRFQGLESVADAVEFLQSGNSIGKVVVDVSSDALNQKLISAL